MRRNENSYKTLNEVRVILRFCFLGSDICSNVSALFYMTRTRTRSGMERLRRGRGLGLVEAFSGGCQERALVLKTHKKCRILTTALRPRS